MMFEAEHLVDATVDSLYRGSQVVGLRPFFSGSCDGYKDSAVELKWHPHDPTEVSYTQRRKLFTFFPSRTLETKCGSGTAILESISVFLEAHEGQFA